MIVYKGTQIRQVDTLHWLLQSGLIKDWRVAVDGGANVGEWSDILAQHFGTVHAFEPGEMFQAKAPNVIRHKAALLDRRCRVILNRKGNDRGWWVTRDDWGDVRATTIDDLALKSCGLIKLDLEGADGLALEGGAETIRKHGPVIMVELGKQRRKRPGASNKAIRRFLRERGYGLAHRIECDHIFTRG